MEDPFEIVKEDVEKSIAQLRQLHQHLKNTPSHQTQQPGHRWKLEELEQQCRTIEWDLQDLQETVAIAEKNPQKFKLTQQQMEGRRLFLHQTENELASIREFIKQQQGVGGNQADNNQKRPNHAGTPAASGATSGGKRYETEESPTHPLGMQQELIMRDQDQQLDQVYHTVVNMKNIAKEMGQELESQEVLIDNMSQKVDGTNDRLRAAQNRIKQILQAEGVDNKTFWIIVALSLVVLILFVVVLI